MPNYAWCDLGMHLNIIRGNSAFHFLLASFLADGYQRYAKYVRLSFRSEEAPGS